MSGSTRVVYPKTNGAVAMRNADVSPAAFPHSFLAIVNERSIIAIYSIIEGKMLVNVLTPKMAKEVAIEIGKRNPYAYGFCTGLNVPVSSWCAKLIYLRSSYG